MVYYVILQSHLAQFGKNYGGLYFSYLQLKYVNKTLGYKLFPFSF